MKYERIVLRELRCVLLDPARQYRSLQGGIEQHVRIESVEIDASEQEHEIIVLLQDLKRLECLFGWSAPAVEPEVFEANWRRSLEDAAEMHATITLANLEEDTLAIGYGLPKSCSPDDINWF